MSREQKPMSPLGVVATVALALGLVLWAWTGWWQWAVTGLAGLLVLAALGAYLERRTSRPENDNGDGLIGHPTGGSKD